MVLLWKEFLSHFATQLVYFSVKLIFWTLTIIHISIKLCFGSWIFFRLQAKKEGQKP
jgi:hypothetical protein